MSAYAKIGAALLAVCAIIVGVVALVADAVRKAGDDSAPQVAVVTPKPGAVPQTLPAEEIDTNNPVDAPREEVAPAPRVVPKMEEEPRAVEPAPEPIKLKLVEPVKPKPIEVPNPAIEKLEGRWRVVREERLGLELNEPGATFAVIEGDKLRVAMRENGLPFEFASSFEIDAASQPQRIILTIDIPGVKPSPRLLGICELREDRLKLCFGEGLGVIVERHDYPRSFATGSGKGKWLLELRRTGE